MVADSVALPEGRRAAGVLRRRALLRRLQAQPRVRAAGARGRGDARTSTRSCCATPTAARCPTRWSAIVGEVVAHFGDLPIGIHTQNDTGCAVANSVAAVLAGATQLQGTINGYGERTGNANLMVCIPNLTLKMGIEHAARGADGAADRGEPPRGRAGEPAARPRRSPTSACRPSPTRPACTRRRIARQPDSYEHVDPDRGRQPHPVPRVRPGRPGDDGAQGHGDGRRARRRRRGRRSPTGSSSSSPRATTSRRPTPRSSC